MPVRSDNEQLYDYLFSTRVTSHILTSMILQRHQFVKKPHICSWGDEDWQNLFESKCM